MADNWPTNAHNKHQELELIRNNLRESGRQIRFVADVATACSLCKILNAGCQMLHFAGHGNENSLAFEFSHASQCGLVKQLKVGPFFCVSMRALCGYKFQMAVYREISANNRTCLYLSL